MISDVTFEYYFTFSVVTSGFAFVLMVVGLLIHQKQQKLKTTLAMILAFMAIVALGMSNDIKHVNFIGCIHAIIAFCIAIRFATSSKSVFAKLLYVPCGLIVIVLLFNILHVGRGLELFGRWITA